jgi:hypothetical protein
MDRTVQSRRRREAQHLYDRVLALRGKADLDLVLAPFDYPEIWDALTKEQQTMIDRIRDEVEGFTDSA